MANYNNYIAIPFANEGIRAPVPETAPDGVLNQTQGFTEAYRTPPNEGGQYIPMPQFNQVMNTTQSAIKEVQDKAVLSVNYAPPDEDGNVTVAASSSVTYGVSSQGFSYTVTKCLSGEEILEMGGVIKVQGATIIMFPLIIIPETASFTATAHYAIPGNIYFCTYEYIQPTSLRMTLLAPGDTFGSGNATFLVRAVVESRDLPPPPISLTGSAVDKTVNLTWQEGVKI